MKKTSLIYTLALAVISFTAVSARADYVLGSWTSSSNPWGEGWIDYSSTQPLQIIASKYSIATGVVSGYSQSLEIQQNGWGHAMELQLGSVAGDQAAFLTNNTLSFTFSAPAATNTGGWNQVYSFTLNAGGYGFNNVGDGNNASTTWGNTALWSYTDVVGSDNNSPEPNYYYGPAATTRTEIVSLNYSSILPTLIANDTYPSGYINISFDLNTGGGAATYMYFNNVDLSEVTYVPEPATGALILAGGAMALFLVRRRAQKSA
jgi:hypothetical protein